MKAWTSLAAAAALAVGLAACGGGGGGGGATATPTAAPTSAGGGGGACSSGTQLTFNAGAGVTAPYKNGDKVCFTTISTTTLAFDGKTLTGPTQNTAVSAPYSAWKFVDGAYTYEVVFNSGALHEINVSGTSFLGQFPANSPA